MKTIRMTLTSLPAGFEVVRRFGQAWLLQDRTGRWLLNGGRPTERSDAREWISLFCHDALVQTSDTPLLDNIAPEAGTGCRRRPPETASRVIEGRKTMRT